MKRKKGPNPTATQHARSLRKSLTRSEGLLWSVLRAKQVCGLKFRNQHPIGIWTVDFACVEKMLVVEVDGGYHDEVVEEDMEREEQIRALGWDVIRFTDAQVEDDAEAVARMIANHLGVRYSFERKVRKTLGSFARSRD